MKHIKLILPVLSIIFCLVYTNAIMPVPKIELEEYEITSADKSKIYIEGTISIAKGQQVTARMENSYSSIPIVATKLGSSGSKENFQLKIPAAYISQGTNKFYVRSEGLRKVIHPSNMREVVVKISDGDSSENKSQTISASNKSVQVGKTVSLGAKASSGLPLTYSSSNTGIATVSNKGVVTGKKVGICKIIITQNGNTTYKSAKKTIIITVQQSGGKKAQTISVKSLNVEVGKSKRLIASVSSKLKLTYSTSNPKIATIDKNGNIKGKKKGKVTITIKQAGNSNYNPVTKKIVVNIIKANKYKITFEANGGKGKKYTQKIKAGAKTPLKANKFKRSGYAFKGWATSKNGKVKYNNAQQIKGTKDIVLYAKWEKLNTLKTTDGGYIKKNSNKWNLANGLGSYKNIQCMDTDGIYLYAACMYGGSNKGKIAKYKLSSKTLVDTSSSMYLGHANDIAYNHTDGCLYITRNQTNDLKLTKVRASDLKNLGTVKTKIPNNLSGRKYANRQVHSYNGIAFRDGHLYVRSRKGGSIVMRLNSNYKAVRGWALQVKDSRCPAAQGMGFYGKTLYIALSKYGQSSSNYVAKGKLNSSKRKGKFKNLGINGELEGVFTYNNVLYVGVRKPGGTYIKRVY